MARNNKKTRNYTGYRIKIYPNDYQKDRLNQLFRFSRYVYNWGLAENERSYHEDHKRLSFFDIVKAFSDFKKSLEDSSLRAWLNRFTQKTAAMTLKSLTEAFIKFFNHESRYPKFKKKNKTQSVHFRNDYGFKFVKNYFIIDNFGSNSPIKCGYHHIPRNKKYNDITISFDGYNYWLSLTIQDEPYKNFDYPKTEGLGIDVGVRNMATCSDGSVYTVKSLNKLQKRINRLNRRISKDLIRRKIGETKCIVDGKTRTKSTFAKEGKNSIKRRTKLQNCYNKMSNIIKTTAHMASTAIIKKNPKYIVMETLNICGMQSSHNLARDVKQSGMGMIRRFIEYKAFKHNIPFYQADRWFPSSQICSHCGHKQHIGSAKTYVCKECGFTIDRDLNAAINLRDLKAELA